MRAGHLMRVAAASRGATVVPMPAGSGLALLADVADRERRDGGPERVSRRKHPVIPVPVLPWRRHEIGEPVKKLKRREVDHAVRSRARRLAAATGSDPVGRLVSWQRVADASDLTVCTAAHREPLEREGWPRAVSQQMFQTLEEARHITVAECDPDTRVDRKPAVLPGEHVGGRSSIEQASVSEPADQAAAHPLGDRGQVGQVDRAGWQERRRRVVRRPGSRRHEDTVGDAGVQMHVAVEGGAEAVQEGDGAEPRAGGGRRVGCRCHACGSAEQPLDLGKKVFVRAATVSGRSARKQRSRFGTEITHCRTGTVGIGCVAARVE